MFAGDTFEVASGDMRPKTEGILESSLYVDDVGRSAQFYERISGFGLSATLAGCIFKRAVVRLLRPRNCLWTNRIGRCLPRALRQMRFATPVLRSRPVLSCCPQWLAG